ncbi:Crp/Fnr family transcriptional regulator [Frankia sp. AiPs1]|uniref:Crp/Fnr family transcriptional regulator n=1 Tax=Frankia sp. AiPs1 TaxID=573493 RepID=UPI0020439382|nr:Crp/Fnr family transcriptional regulator [Frankia sp. AiPs1]MCM3922915.1 Crp/Fnr family transcriptional regulator [Frankia sp. AiPs1]
MHPWPPASFLGCLTPGTRKELLSRGQRQEFPLGGVLMRQGERTSSLFLLISGAVKITVVSENGDSALVAVRFAGDVIGEMAMIEHQPRAATGTAALPVTAQRIPADDFRQIRRARPEVVEALDRVLAGRLRVDLHDRVTRSRPARARLARLFLDLAAQHGQPVRDGVLIALPLSQPEFGNLITASEPTVQKTISELKRAGVVAVRGHRSYVVRDAATLRRIADAADDDHDR